MQVGDFSSSDNNGRLLDQQGGRIDSLLSQEYRDEFTISSLGDSEQYPRVDTSKDRFVAVWHAGGDIYASLYSLDSHEPAIDPTVQFQPYAVRYDTLTGPIRFHRKVVDDGARIDAGLDYVDFHYARVCPAGDSTAAFVAMSQKAGTDSFYTDIGVQYAGTKIYYYFEAVDSALNESRLPDDAPLIIRGSLKIANPGDININGVIDLNDLLLIEDFMCFPAMSLTLKTASSRTST